MHEYASIISILKINLFAKRDLWHENLVTRELYHLYKVNLTLLVLIIPPQTTKFWGYI